NKRLSIPQAFLAIDAILIIWNNVLDGMVVYPKIIAKRINEELPFMATEYIIMEGVKNGGDRQELHELIREHSMEAARQVKMEGKSNDLVERILADERFNIDKEKLQQRSEEHTSELQSRENLVCRLLLEKKNKQQN